MNRSFPVMERTVSRATTATTTSRNWKSLARSPLIASAPGLLHAEDALVLPLSARSLEAERAAQRPFPRPEVDGVGDAAERFHILVRQPHRPPLVDQGALRHRKHRLVGSERNDPRSELVLLRRIRGGELPGGLRKVAGPGLLGVVARRFLLAEVVDRLAHQVDRLPLPETLPQHEKQVRIDRRALAGRLRHLFADFRHGTPLVSTFRTSTFDCKTGGRAFHLFYVLSEKPHRPQMELQWGTLLPLREGVSPAHNPQASIKRSEWSAPSGYVAGALHSLGLPCGRLSPSASLRRNGRLARQRRDLPVLVADVILEPPDGELRRRVLGVPRRGVGAVDRGAQQLVVADPSGGGIGAGGDEHGRCVPLLRPPDGAPHKLEAGEESLLEVDLDVGQLRRRRPPMVQNVVHPHGPALLCALMRERSSNAVPMRGTPEPGRS